MAYLEWKPEYSVGSPAIDGEHREMIDLINTLRDELGDAADKESIERFLGDIQSGIAMHFALEERLMRDNGYSEYAAHKQDHEELLDQIFDIMNDVIGEQSLATMGERISTWFGKHFATFDARLHGKLGPH